MIKFLFGKAGSGKSYVGKIASLAYGFHFHDADGDLPERFRKAVERREKVTEDVREEFLQAIITTARRLSISHRDVCICQALPRDRLRQRIVEAIPSVEFIWVDAPGDLITARLRERSGHLASAEYADSLNRIFEEPTVPHVKFVNGDDAAEWRHQLEVVFGVRAKTSALTHLQSLHGQAMLGKA